ncbi:MAG TPA: gliding motility-associated C-terminal domain-containing protein, partial [Spirochaetales bacterium]|nr:gliding motility-associated C-terminal domain-containing protein [Spirochaetales bacterium]
REAIAGADQGLLPSFGLGASFSVDRTTPEGGEAQPWDRSEIRPSLAAHQLYNDIWGFAAGINMPLGVIDRSPPKVNPGYPETAYISPNADGAKDELVLPIKIEDQRFVQGFALKIYDDKGELVRSIANKESRPESESFSGFWKRLVYVKKGVPVPEELVWNGLADSGQTVPDGTYTFVIEAEDDNGNQAVTERYTVVVDNTPPTVAATPSAGADTPIFSPDGDGNKDSLGINHVSSSEDLWTAEVVDATGTVIRTWEIKSADVGALAWDGKNEAGQIVPDGVYGYRVAAVDRAGNAGSAKVDNIIVNTQQPPVSVTIDLGAFSPNADGVKDALTLSPSVPVRTGLASWSLAVVDAAGKERWTVTGTGENSLEADYRFDGKDASGAALPEGTYRTQLVAKYVNGHTPTVWSPDFVIDLSPPTAKASSDRQAFNPLGDVRALVTISQSGSEEEAWQGQVLNAEGTAVKTWNFIGQPDQKLTWDGSDDAGATVPDGQYIYRLSAVDKAGNKTQVSTPAILVDTEKKAVRLALDRRAFSPNGDGTSDTVAIQPDVQSASRVRDWTLSIAGPDGNPVRVFKGTAAPSARVLWDGKTDAGQKAPDGGYLAVLEVRYTTDEVETARSVELTLDTVAPSITVSADDTLFSPNGDGRKDSLTIGQSSAAGDSWTGTVYNAAGKAVRVWSWRDQATALEWDGKDANGNVVPDGTYRYVVHSEDAAGNRAEKTVSGIGVDNRQVQVFVTAAAEGFSPNGDGVADTLSVSSIVNQKDGVASWRLAFVDASGAARKTLSGTAIASLPAKLTWDGKGDDGAVVQGQYTAVLTVDYRKGDRAEAKTAAFTLDSEGPRLSLSVGPRYFSPDNDGVDDELKVSLGVADLSALDTWRFDIYEVAVQEGSGDRKERLFFSWNGRGRPAERLTWDGRSQRGELVEAATDYVYRFSIQDAWGNKSVAEGV